MLTEQTIKKFHLVQTSGQLIILLVCGLLGLTRGGLFEQTQMFDVLLCLLLSLLEFSLLVPEKESPKRWQLFNHYFETVALCYT
ncbi:hypothetical protein EQ500_08680, partial [Lactobacillus sp. XV13L]|nr:hypothetical protein [Lactobacillus sp. XV13L]